jgi:histidinol-phosphate aminotransferase
MIRPHLREVEPYTTARSQHHEGLLLDANEMAIGCPLPGRNAGLHRYPDPRTPELRSALARQLEVAGERLWIGNGSDEAIDVLVRTAVDPGDRVVVATPTYGVYGIRARTHGARVEEVRLDGDYDLDVDATARAAEGARIVFLCSPNNPTGNRLSPERIGALVSRVDALVVVDEAYVEFARASSLVRRVGRAPSLVVLRTFSKAWGLAAARVGYAVAHPELVRAMDLVGLPYPLSEPAARAARGALECRDRVRDAVEEVRRERERLADALTDRGFRVLPSEANFLCFFVARPGAIHRALMEDHGVVVRDRSDLPGLDGALRVTVGTGESNDRFLEALDAAGATPAEGSAPSASREGRV